MINSDGRVREDTLQCDLSVRHRSVLAQYEGLSQSMESDMSQHGIVVELWEFLHERQKCGGFFR